jgi:hypothetical protein
MTTLGVGKPLLPRRIVDGFRLESVRAIGTSMIAGLLLGRFGDRLADEAGNGKSSVHQGCEFSTACRRFSLSFVLFGASPVLLGAKIVIMGIMIFLTRLEEGLPCPPSPSLWLR